MKPWTMLWVVLGCACGQSTDPTPPPSAETPSAERKDPPSQAATAPAPTLEIPEKAPSEPTTPPPSADRPRTTSQDSSPSPTEKAASANKPKKAAPTQAPENTTETAKTATEPGAEKDREPKKHTRIPRTQHVRVRVSPAMQKLLDGDSRMQPWVNKVMQVAQRCYAQELAKNAKAGGVMKVQVTMHESARPTPDIKDLPPSLSGVVACATGALFQTRMPLFTGPEGARHDVSLHFTP